MKRFLLFLLVPVFFCPVYSQGEEDGNEEKIIIDSLYREDQFYVGFTFNLLRDLPETVSQSGFSGGLHLGFIRDMPINKRRNLALGLGLGWGTNTYAQNLFIGETQTGKTIFRSLNAVDAGYDSNRFTTYLVEVPLELRWRSSTASSYSFWRVYAGIKLGYLYHFKSNFKQPGNQVVQTKIDELDRFRMGATLAVGYSKVNFYLYYGLNPFFGDGYLPTGETVGVKTIKIGLMFYIL